MKIPTVTPVYNLVLVFHNSYTFFPKGDHKKEYEIKAKARNIQKNQRPEEDNVNVYVNISLIPTWFVPKIQSPPTQISSLYRSLFPPRDIPKPFVIDVGDGHEQIHPFPHDQSIFRG